MPEPASSKLEGQGAQSSGATLTVVLLGVIVVAALYFGREVLVPIALAVLLSFVLAPLVRLLQGWLVPAARRGDRRDAAGAGRRPRIGRPYGGASQPARGRAAALPVHASRRRSSSLRGAFGRHRHARARFRGAAGLSKELERRKPFAPCSPPIGEQAAPTARFRSKCRQPDPGALHTLAALITPLIYPLTTTGIVFIFVIFILSSSRICETG